jgi:hypothetical protein
MFFKRKVNEEKPLCFHEWRVTDFGVGYEYNGVSEDSYVYYDLGCKKCGAARRVSDYEYYRMISAGVVK